MKFIPHIEVIHQSFGQAGRRRDGLSPPLLWGRGKGLEQISYLRGGAKGFPHALLTILETYYSFWSANVRPLKKRTSQT